MTALRDKLGDCRFPGQPIGFEALNSPINVFRGSVEMRQSQGRWCLVWFKNDSSRELF